MKAAALKAVEAFVSVGSNPTPVANLLEVVIGTRRKIGGFFHALKDSTSTRFRVGKAKPWRTEYIF